jgi:hypothetical protein
VKWPTEEEDFVDLVSGPVGQSPPRVRWISSMLALIARTSSARSARVNALATNVLVSELSGRLESGRDREPLDELTNESGRFASMRTRVTPAGRLEEFLTESARADATASITPATCPQVAAARPGSPSSRCGSETRR